MVFGENMDSELHMLFVKLVGGSRSHGRLVVSGTRPISGSPLQENHDLSLKKENSVT